MKGKKWKVESKGWKVLSLRKSNNHKGTKFFTKNTKKVFYFAVNSPADIVLKGVLRSSVF